MKPILGIALVVIATGFLSSHAAAQQPEPGVWFGISPSPTGASADERFQIQATSTGAVILWAPFGKTPVSWGPITLRQDGAIEFHWAGNPSVPCVLRRGDEGNYEGTCLGSSRIERRLTLTRNGRPYGLELPVSDMDFRILAKARQILSGPSVWNRHDDRYCEDDAKQNSWSLFCALHQASDDVAGKYLHLRPVMMEVRAAVGEVTNGQSFNQILLEYNNLESTTYANIAAVFDRAEKRLQTKKACAEQQGSKWTADKQYTLPIPNGDLVPRGQDKFYWGEGLSYTAQKKTDWLIASVGPIATSGKVPDDWLAASTTITVRTWKRGDLGGVDVKGTLRNGNHWRYFCQCGEAFRYNDAPAKTASYFDSIVDGGHPHAGQR